MEVRPYRRDDVEQVLELVKGARYEFQGYYRSFSSDKTRAVLVNGLTDPEFEVIIAVVEHEVVGMIAGEVCNDIFGTDRFVQGVLTFVRKDWRKANVFRQLLLRFEQWAVEQNPDYILLGQSTGYRSDAYERLMTTRYSYCKLGIQLRKEVAR